MNIPPQEIPTGIDYQMVVVSVMGDKSFSQLAEFEKNGWRRVPVDRHRKIRSVDPKWIEQGGLALVERPQYLTECAKVWEQSKADAQLLSVPVAVIASPSFRKVNLKATTQRKRTIKEFFVLHFWRLRVWARDKIADWRSR